MFNNYSYKIKKKISIDKAQKQLLFAFQTKYLAEN